MSTHPRVRFCADNRYDQYYASTYGINFYYNDIIRLTPPINNDLHINSANNGKLFVYNRGTKINYYNVFIDKLSVKYDIYGEQYDRYRDNFHIAEYLAYIHLPYQVNIQSLYENLAHGIIYLIPSRSFITDLICNQSWYYWEEKNKNIDMLLKSIELAEWYQSDIQHLFVYFDSWDDIQNKINELTPDAIVIKKQSIYDFINKNNQCNLDKWNYLFKIALA